jgi:uncharacterized protein (UPF0147 family)
MPVPNNVRSIARQTYRQFLMTGNTTGHVNRYRAEVECLDNIVLVYEAPYHKDSTIWVVPIAKSW